MTSVYLTRRERSALGSWKFLAGLGLGLGLARPCSAHLYSTLTCQPLKSVDNGLRSLGASKSMHGCAHVGSLRCILC